MQKERAGADEGDALLEVLIAQGCSVEKALRIARQGKAGPNVALDRHDRPKGFIAGR